MERYPVKYGFLRCFEVDLSAPQGSAIGVVKYRKTGVFDFLGNVRTLEEILRILRVLLLSFTYFPE